MNVISDDASKPWWMLVLLSLTLFILTLNWFDVAAAFPEIRQQFHLDISQLSNLIAFFILGFAIFHIPAGMLAYRFGVKNTLLIGLLLESLGGIACAFAPNYAVLAVLRILTGAGASFIVGMSLSLVTSWFRGRELALALGISAGASFTIGMAIALLGWIGVIQAVGWQIAIVLGGAIGILVFVFCWLFLRVPNFEAKELSAGKFEWKAIGRVLSNRDLWLAGFSFFGVYGAGLVTAQLLTVYLSMTYHLSAEAGGIYAALFTLMAIPGSLVGGFLADRSKKHLRAIFVWPWALLGVCLCLLPFIGKVGVLLGVVIAVAGACQQFGFSAWSALPGLYRDRVYPEDVATAEGLMLTAGGLGGFVLPILFGIMQATIGWKVAFLFGGVASIVFALLGFAAREPQHINATVRVLPTTDKLDYSTSSRH